MDEGELERFCNELAPRLETAQTLAHELDRELARRFNAFDYLRMDEMGLSKVIADLLNPRGAHGQGDAFLQRLLDMLDFKDFDPRNSRVDVELPIEKGRIDIAVRTDDACLAIENKPYAHDQEGQVKKYLCWLGRKYTDGGRDSFRLIYLRANGEPPSKASVKLCDLKKCYTETFRIMPYYRVDGSTLEDGYEGFRTNFTLTDWLKECRKDCDVERLRWFLREAEVYCQRQFGGDGMTNNELKTVKKFVLESNRNVVTAAAIQGAWDSIRNKIFESFIEVLEKRAKDKLQDMEVAGKYGGGAYDNGVRVRLTGWHKHSISIWSDAIGPRRWLVGVSAPSTNDWERESREQREAFERQRTTLENSLRSKLGDAKHNHHLPWFKYLDRFHDWRPLIPAIHAEIEKEEGPITSYFVETLTKVATVAAPILNEVEGT